ncbi:phosphotransferase family protein [Nocardia cerradoensis]|uniref:phosphotransferase family protein n=1 Tax=Nocardia cerradoensis TaxID=85688 RepID=UPI0005845928|nr:phosphotransferase family protein [Nocardia cerradoensis]NKY43739.1 phosphotransferase family protein [Nocardia cerradoensis]
MTRVPTEQLPSMLEPILQQRIPNAQRGRVRNWSASPRGLATETCLFDFDCPGTTHSLVFRRPPEVALFPDYDLLRQVLVMQRLAGSGIPIPTVRWLDRDGGALGGPYMVMDRIPGEAPSDYPSYHTAGNYFDADRDGRQRMWWGCVDTIADVHRLDPQTLKLDFLAFPEHGDEPVEQIVGYIDAALRWACAEPPPALRRGVEWLRANTYEPVHVTLCWGDARMSNILYDTNLRVTGVLDWEVAYLGDHEADLAWMLFLDWACSEYEGHEPLPGTPSREQTIEYYEHRSGMPVENLRFNEILAASLLSIPLLRMTDRLQLPPELDLTAFCAARIDQLLETAP